MPSSEDFLWRALDRLGYQTIADRVNLDPDRYPPPEPILGYGRRRVGAWTASNVREILDNPKHTGYMVWNRRKRPRPERDIRGWVNPPSAWVWSAMPTHEPSGTTGAVQIPDDPAQVPQSACGYFACPGRGSQSISSAGGPPTAWSARHRGACHSAAEAGGSSYARRSRLMLTGIGVYTPVKHPTDGRRLGIDNRIYNALLRSMRCLGQRGFALLTGRWRVPQHVTACPQRSGDIANAALSTDSFRAPIPTLLSSPQWVR